MLADYHELDHNHTDIEPSQASFNLPAEHQTNKSFFEGTLLLSS